MNVRLNGELVAFDELQTWRTYHLEAPDLTVHPADAVRTQRVAESVFTLDVGGWMGVLEVQAGGSRHVLRITDPKFGNDAWNRLFDDLAHAVTALPLAELVDGSTLSRSTSPPTPFVRRLVLRAYAEQIEAAIEAIQRRPHEELFTQEDWVTPDRVTTVTPGGFAAVLARGAFTRVGRVASRLGGFAPTIWRDVRRAVRTDTPENRFARHAIETIHDAARAFSDDAVLRKLGAVARDALSRPPLRDAGPFRRLPRASRVLDRRFGYRELRDAYFALLGSARVRWDGLEDAVRGGLRNVEVLYQYWCFLALQRHLGASQPRLPTTRSTTGLHIDLAQGWASAVPTPAGRLWHERTFQRPDGTYSISLRPDFVLARSDRRLEIFDAKYRIDVRSGDAKNEDLAKMHAYRDAIRDCHAATVLYPGLAAESYPTDDHRPPHAPSGVFVVPLKP